MKAVIYRRYFENCTLGTLSVSNGEEIIFSCKTLELPDQNNKSKISCIPEGVYKIQKENHKKFGECFRILQVPARDGILIHNGNYTSQIRGCILVGKNHIDINKDGVMDVTESKNTLSKLCDFDLDTLEISHF